MSSVLFQGLAAFLKAIGYLIPLMDAEYANYYTREVMLILIREFQSPDEEMKKIVLKVKRRFLILGFLILKNLLCYPNRLSYYITICSFFQCFCPGWFIYILPISPQLM